MNLRKILLHSHIYAGIEKELSRVHVWLLKIKARRVIQQYLARNAIRKLQIGAGPTKSGDWLTTDILAKLRRKTIYLDAIETYPIPTGAIDYVFSEHMIEHISYMQGKKMLAECARILKSGGKIRLATPDLSRLLALMHSTNDDTAREYIAWASGEFLDPRTPVAAIHVLNNQFRNYGHQFLYDETCLRESLTAAGFTDIERLPMGVSNDPNLHDAEKHGINMNNKTMVAFETMVLEARRG
jgi:predicted SAM-dependent methyltransferase